MELSFVVWAFFLLFTVYANKEPLAKREYDKNHYFAIQISPTSGNSHERAKSIASHFDYEYLGPIGELEDYFLFSKEKGTMEHSHDEHVKLMKRHDEHPDIVATHHQTLRKRHKRALVESDAEYFSKAKKDFMQLQVHDPLFFNQWHLVLKTPLFLLLCFCIVTVMYFVYFLLNCFSFHRTLKIE
jgi:hypothetical protein